MCQIYNNVYKLEDFFRNNPSLEAFAVKNEIRQKNLFKTAKFFSSSNSCKIRKEYLISPFWSF